MTTRLYHHPVFAEHLTGPGHPERPERMAAVAKAFADPRFDALSRLEAPEGTTEAIGRCHSEQHLRRVAKAVPG